MTEGRGGLGLLLIHQTYDAHIINILCKENKRLTIKQTVNNILITDLKKKNWNMPKI